MARTYQYSARPCEHCRREPADPDRGPALWITDARPMNFGGRVGIIESNPGDPKLCDDCEMVRRESRRCR